MVLMRYAACLSLETHRPFEGPIGKTGFRHAVVTVLSSSPSPLQTLGGELVVGLVVGRG
jgi:hypothetical protein